MPFAGVSGQAGPVAKGPIREPAVREGAAVTPSWVFSRLEVCSRASLVGNQRSRVRVQAPESMSLRGLRLIIDGEDRQSHGGPLALPARFTWRFQQASPLVKKPLFHPIPLPFPGA